MGFSSRRAIRKCSTSGIANTSASRALPAGATWRGVDQPEIPFSVLAIFSGDTNYFGSGPLPFMINFRVDNLRELLKALLDEGVQVDEKVEEHDYGKFGWITDPEGNRLELWEPPKSS